MTASVGDIPADMRRYWYPISLSRDVLSGDIVGLHILGDPICLFRDKKGQAVCLADRCAHRSAPLSLGQFRDDHLECKYHGWKYDAEGKVAHIPALLPDRQIPANAHVHRYPLEERYGLIWIWPGPTDDADPLQIPHILPGLEDPSKWSEVFTIAVDLDIDHSLMVENLLDPAHLPFTHENTLSKRSAAKPLEMTSMVVDVSSWAANPESKQKLFALHGSLKASRPDLKSQNFYFIAPCHIALRTEFTRPGWKFAQTMHCVPTRPGHMRLFYLQSRSFLTWFETIPGISIYTTHLAKKIIFQDYELLHGQQARLQQGAKAWHTPIQVDGLPKMYRQWLRRAMSLDIAVGDHDDYAVCTGGGGDDSADADNAVVVGKRSRGPWFSGWYPCSMKNAVKDIEELDKACQHDCSVPPSGEQAATLDATWTVPNQRGVDNSSYTWRRDKNLGKDVSWNPLWHLTTISVSIIAAVLIAKYA